MGSQEGPPVGVAMPRRAPGRTGGTTGIDARGCHEKSNVCGALFVLYAQVYGGISAPSVRATIIQGVEGALGCGAHTDCGFLTILLQDEVRPWVLQTSRFMGGELIYEDTTHVIYGCVSVSGVSHCLIVSAKAC